MEACKIARNFEGIDGVVSSTAYNDIICVLDSLIYSNDVLEDYRKNFGALKYKLLKLSMFDRESELVHIRLGLKELSLITLAMEACLPDGEYDYFSERANDDSVKLWIESEKEMILEAKDE